MKKHLNLFFAVAIITVIFGTIYVVAQQSLRLGANDLPTLAAEDAAAMLNKGSTPEEVTTISGNIDIASSLTPFTIIYDKSGKVVAGTGQLDGSVPTVPIGVLKHATPGHDNRVTWQPKNGVRIASVSVAADKYYVLGGRNMREVEKNEDVAFNLSLSGWLASMVVFCLFYWFRRMGVTPKK